VSSIGWRELRDGGFGDPAGEELAEVVTGYLLGDSLEVFDFGGCVEVPLDELFDGGEERLVSNFESQGVVEEGSTLVRDAIEDVIDRINLVEGPGRVGDAR